jgi:hypothetical protein
LVYPTTIDPSAETAWAWESVEYRRHASKRSYRWPRKKDPPTIRPPVVTTATAAQVQQARQFRSSRTAA